MFLNPVKVVEHAVCHVVIASDDLLAVAPGKIHSSGSDVVDVASVDSAAPARSGDFYGYVAYVPEFAILEFNP